MKCHIEKDWQSMTTKIWLYKDYETHRDYYFMKDGELQIKRINSETYYEEEDKAIPFMKFGYMFKTEHFAQAMVDAFKDAGLKISSTELEISNAKTLADERLVELNYFKELNTKLIESKI